MKKSLLKALLTPWDLLKEARGNYEHTTIWALEEETKTLPRGKVWKEYLTKGNMAWYSKMLKDLKGYEPKSLMKKPVFVSKILKIVFW